MKDLSEKPAKKLIVGYINIFGTLGGREKNKRRSGHTRENQTNSVRPHLGRCKKENKRGRGKPRAVIKDTPNGVAGQRRKKKQSSKTSRGAGKEGNRIIGKA